MLCDSVQVYALKGCQDVASYADGPYAASPAALPFHTGRSFRIDVSGQDPSADVLDIEPGDASPSTAGTWCEEHTEVSGRACRLYTTRGAWPAVKAAVGRSVPRADVLYWIADPTGTPHTIAGADAVQWGWEPTVDYSTETARWKSAA